jgi:hypothetical protein
MELTRINNLFQHTQITASRTKPGPSYQLWAHSHVCVYVENSAHITFKLSPDNIKVPQFKALAGSYTSWLRFHRFKFVDLSVKGRD